MTNYEKRKCAFFERHCYIYGWKPSGNLINFCLQGYLFELSPEAKAFQKQKDMIWKETKKIMGLY